MKISFFGPFKKEVFEHEGQTKIAFGLKRFLEGEGFKIDINNPNADVIHVHSSGILPYLSALKYRSKKTQVIFSIYGAVKDYRHSFLRSFVAESLSGVKKYRMGYMGKTLRDFISAYLSLSLPMSVKRGLLKKADLVIFPNKILYNAFNLDNSKVINIGIDCTKFKNYGLKRRTFTVSYFGSKYHGEGLPDVVKAFKRLQGRGFNLNLYIKDLEGRKIDKFYQFAELDPKKIHVYGHVSDIEKKYNEADVVIFPIRAEVASISTPLVLLESMACERAIVATNLPNINKTVRGAAVLVDPFSPDQIVNAVNMLEKNPSLRKQLGEKAREGVLKHYNQDKMFREYLKVYENLSKHYV